MIFIIHSLCIYVCVCHSVSQWMREQLAVVYMYTYNLQFHVVQSYDDKHKESGKTLIIVTI